jgi:uncharacterized membrane protein
MTAFLTILACFAGVFAFAFGAAGFLGLMSFEPPSKKGGLLLGLLDHTFTFGAFTALSEISRNWESRPAERRLLYVGFACGVACIILVVIIRKML